MGKYDDQMLGSQIANSRPINCPVKRDTRAKRVYLDSSMMREIYLRNVGVWNSRFVAETQLEAKENSVDILEFRNHTQVRHTSYLPWKLITIVPRRFNKHILQCVLVDIRKMYVKLFYKDS